MLYNVYINFQGLYKMSDKNTLIISHKSKDGRFDFGTIFLKCNTVLDLMGCFSNKKTKLLANSLEMNFCTSTQGTMYGHFPFYLPLPNGDYQACSIFFHLSTLPEENLNNHSEQFSITMSFFEDGVSELFLSAFAKYLKTPEHSFYIGSSHTDLEELKVEGVL